LRIIFTLGMALLILPIWAAAAASDIAEPEDELKAATVLAFLQNAKWPDQTADPDLTVGIVGRPAFAQVLRRTLEGKSVNGRTVRVLTLKSPAEARCQVIYVATDRKQEIESALSGATAAHLLTIGESNHFLDSGGAINLFLADGHMSFEVSISTLDRCNVAISSKLLRFGKLRDLPKGKAPG